MLAKFAVQDLAESVARKRYVKNETIRWCFANRAFVHTDEVCFVER